MENDARTAPVRPSFGFFRHAPLSRPVAIAGLCALVLAGCENGVGTTSTGGGDDDDDDGTTIVPGSCNDPEALEDFAEWAEARLQDGSVPGAAIAIVCNGELEWSRGFGVKKYLGSDAVDGDTLFQMASVSKGMAAAAALSLQEDGLLSLDAPVSAHIASPVWGSIPLEMFFAHTSGFSTWFQNDTDYSLAGNVLDNVNQPLWSEPGAVFNYSNVGYSIAGHAMAVAAGKPFADVVEERVFEPAGMTRATYSVPEVMADGNFAWGYDGAAVSPEDGYYAGEWYFPMGGVWCSANDLARWATTHFTGTSALSPAGFEDMRTSRTPTAAGDDYGLGLDVVVLGHPLIAGHSGSTLGYTSDWRFVPETGFAVVVLTANDGYNPGEISWEAIYRFVDPAFEPFPDPGTVAEVVGTYEGATSFGTVVVTDQGGGTLAASFNGSAPAELTNWYGDAYTVVHPTDGEIDFNFWRPNGGPAEYVVSLWGVAKRE